MFRNRRSSQKPTDELYAAFKQNFPSFASINAAATSSAAPAHGVAAAATEAPSSTLNPSQLEAQHDFKDHALTPQGANDSWRFTPTLFEHNPSFSMGTFNNTVPGYYTPTSGGLNTVYHNPAAGDLHTPNLAFQLGTPLSMPVADGSFDAIQGFNPQLFQTPQYQSHSHFNAHQTGFAPGTLVHQDSGYGPMEGSPDNDADISAGLISENAIASAVTQRFGESMTAPRLPSQDKFRWHITLTNAPTAMVRRSDEIPITYLNKGQAYSISIVDTNPPPPSAIPAKYRTTIRISFEDEQQRQKPGTCWQLWKEGRGLAESHQRGGKLQAVEYVDPHPGAEDDPRRPKLEVEKISFDSFSVFWSPPAASNTAECSVAVRFNFLSTDFSHSKGVKGIPVRLCAKTQMVSSESADEAFSAFSEVCYCKVKLFRDHGAERKLANDKQHVQKTIDKLSQQISQMESGMKDSSKRKRTASMAGKVGGERPGKLAKHKRTWSISSQGSSGRPSMEEDLYQKRAAMQDMFTSTRPVSVLYLKGEEQDDPDQFPVSLPGGSQSASKAELARMDPWDQKRGGDASPSVSSLVSPVPSSRSMPEKPTLARSSTIKSSRQASMDWPISATLPTSTFSPVLGNIPSAPIKIKTCETIPDGPEWIEAVDVDTSYIPPAERVVKPIACLYVLIKIIGKKPGDDYYRAVYLMQRTVSDLISSIASKCNVDPSRVQRCLRVNPKGLKILVDEELVREIPEGQDMIIEFQEVDVDIKLKQEPRSDLGASISSPAVSALPTSLEMRLLF